jgi:hypothetical protein
VVGASTMRRSGRGEVNARLGMEAGNVGHANSTIIEMGR